MIGYVRLPDEDDTPTEYYCERCGSFITNSGALTALNGASRHSFTNPAGVRCNFRTFLHCDNVLVDENLYREHSWFSGYGWRFLMCSKCFLHLGWRYDGLEGGREPEIFFGVLIDSVNKVKADE